MPLRPYQVEALENIRRADIEGIINLLVVLPCGCGKTVIASNLPTALDLSPFQSQLFLVHRDELALQACEEFREANPSLTVGLEKAEYRTDGNCDITVASVQTLARSPERLAKLNTAGLRIVVVDEGHHLPSNSWSKVLDDLHCLKGSPHRDPGRLFLTITATPRRGDGIGLEKFCDRIVFHRSSRGMIDAGWLAEPVGYRVSSGEDLGGVATRAGDFAIGQLEEAVNTPERNALVVKKYLEFGQSLPAICFSVDVQHSEDLAATFRQHGLHFEALSGTTPTARRRELVEEHKRGNLLGLVSCGVLVEGFNSPIATVALMARPTQSGLLFQQMAGRVLRPYPAPEAAATHVGYRKQNAIIIDFVGVSERFRLYTAATLFGLNPNFDMQGRSITKTLDKLEELAKDNPTLDLAAYTGLDEVEAASTQVDLWRPAPIPKLAKSCSKFIWIQQGEDLYRLSAPGMAVFIEQNHLGTYEVWRHVDKEKPDGHMTFQEPEDAFALADSLVPDDLAILLTAKARWRKEAPTEPQCNLLYFKDPVIRKRFSNGQAFHRFARYQFERGNQAFSKGSVSMRIELCKRAKQNLRK